MSFKNFLQKAGADLAKILHIGTEAAEAAEPVVDIAEPAVAPLFNAAVAEAIKAEATVGSAPGTGATKLAAAAEALLPQAQAFATANGIPVPADSSTWVTAFQSAIAEAVKLIPPPAETSAGSSTT